jgi:predicted RNase H-like HicB family nuclease
MALPYTIILKKDSDGDTLAGIMEMKGCLSHGITDAQAIAHLRMMQKTWIEEALSANLPVPEPTQENLLPDILELLQDRNKLRKMMLDTWAVLREPAMAYLQLEQDFKAKNVRGDEALALLNLSSRLGERIVNAFRKEFEAI